VEPTAEEIKKQVRKHYAAAISQVDKTDAPESEGAHCCSIDASAAAKTGVGHAHARRAGYTDEEIASIPEHAAAHSFGCGNPLAFSGVKEGDVVLDLGSGAGIDALLASRKVGPSGHVIGLDMTSEMIEKAEENARRAGATNVEFRLGEMEKMPVDDSSVDWVISNCVINLSPDKAAVFRETFRVLKPGGQVLVSDICIGDIDGRVRDELFTWADCIGGAVDEETYVDIITRAGLDDVRIVNRVTYPAEDLRSYFEADKGLTPEELAARDPLWCHVDHKVSSIRVYARKVKSGPH
jgi:SAM-dependent methyltransferase